MRAVSSRQFTHGTNKRCAAEKPVPGDVFLYRKQKWMKTKHAPACTLLTAPDLNENALPDAEHRNAVVSTDSKWHHIESQNKMGVAFVARMPSNTHLANCQGTFCN